MRTIPTTTVYRVERYGIGPYAGADPARELDARCAFNFIDSGDDGHPPPQFDPKLAPFFKIGRDEFGTNRRVIDEIFAGEFLHGFETFDALLDWFHSTSLDALLAAGFSVYEYRLPASAAIHGTYQSLFDSAAIAEFTNLTICEGWFD